VARRYPNRVTRISKKDWISAHSAQSRSVMEKKDIENPDIAFESARKSKWGDARLGGIGCISDTVCTGDIGRDATGY